MSTLNIRFWLAATLSTATVTSSSAFLPSSFAPQPTSPIILHGIQEWRDQAYSEHYSLDIFNQQQSSDTPPSIPATIPILPFPFTDILLQGQRTQLNLYEQRFHQLFTDAMDNHHGMVGMGLLLGGSGMITTMPLCEVESFTRFGAQENWVDDGSGMGNGSIFVTIRAVGRVKIVEEDLLQEEPYIKARVVEVLDEAIDTNGEIGIKEDGSESSVVGESSPIQIGSLVASTIENLMVSLSSMEYKLNQVRQKQETAKSTAMEENASNNKETENEKDDGVMNKRLEAARLEELFMKDSSEGVDLEDSTSSNLEEEEEDEDDDDDDDLEINDRVAQFHQAFEDAKETDNQGYILPPTTASDNLSQTDEQSARLRSPKDLTAISWAAFCTGPKDNSKESIKRQAIQIQALDMTNVIQRMQLASAMLREEQKSLKAKLALAGIQDIMRGGDGGDIGKEE